MKWKKQKNAAKGYVLALSLLWVLGCGGSANKSEGDAAALPQLPQADAQNLKPVLNSHVLATRVLQLAPRAKTEKASTPPPPCAADQSVSYFDVEVSYRVTVCRSFEASEFAPESVVGFSYVRHPTHRLDSAILPADVQSAAANFLCRTDSGPWQAQLTSERICIDTCSPVNTLALINTPNLIEVGWNGSIDAVPPGFTYDSTPKLIEPTIDLGSCYVPKRK